MLGIVELHSGGKHQHHAQGDEAPGEGIAAKDGSRNANQNSFHLHRKIQLCSKFSGRIIPEGCQNL